MDTVGWFSNIAQAVLNVMGSGTSKLILMAAVIVLSPAVMAIIYMMLKNWYHKYKVKEAKEQEAAHQAEDHTHVVIENQEDNAQALSDQEKLEKEIEELKKKGKQ